MYLFLPYRTKNPPERFPVCTVGLILANLFIYALTSRYFLAIRWSVVEAWAVSHDTLSVPRLLSSLFLHASLSHLAGNLLFLWIFGPAVEGRLRPLRFLTVYLLAGVTGNLLQDAIVGVIQPSGFTLGASGAIQGLAGAYLYMFPFVTTRVLWFVLMGFRARGGIAEWHAQWVIGLFTLLDVINGFLFLGSGGVAHFAHLGGLGLGFGGMMLLRAKRDSEDFSEAQAMRSDLRGDYRILAYHELEALMDHPADNVPLILAFCHKAATRYNNDRHPECLAALRQHGRLLIEKGDVDLLAQIVLRVPVGVGAMPPAFYLRLGSRLESLGSYENAALVYRRLYDLEPKTADTEMALFRWGRLLEQTAPDKAQAAAVYGELLRLFPASERAKQVSPFVQTYRLPGVPALVFSTGDTPPEPPVAAPVDVPGGVADHPGALDDLSPVSRPAAFSNAIAPPAAEASADVAPLGGQQQNVSAADVKPIHGDRTFDDVRPLGS